MSLTDKEILELEALLEARNRDKLINSLTHLDENTSPNYRILYESVNGQQWGTDEQGRPKLIKGVTGCVLEGSSRSTKTFSGVFLIIYLSLIKHKNDGCTINLYRETYNEFKTTLYDDFKRILNMFGLPNKFNENEEVKSFKIGKSKIHFLGDGKHGGSCDYAFFNEVMMQKESVFNQVEMRCRKFWWMDYNPSFTQHWVFDRILNRPDVSFLRTTFKDNPHISPTELNKILGYEPWLPDSYEVTPEGELLYNGLEIDDINQPPPHPTNIDSGTADETMWKIYGLGLRGAMKGQIFKNIKWIDQFPKYLDYTFGIDFGFVCFTGDTLIKTINGDIPIKDVKKGDLVLTRSGYKKVLNNFDNGVKKVVEKRIDFDFGYKKIRATLEHNFNVDYNKWKKLGDLQKTDNLCVLLDSTTSNTEDTRTVNTQTIISENGNQKVDTTKKGYIMRCMNFIMEKFQMAMSFITSTTTLLITTLIISCVLLQQNIVRFMLYLKNICKQKNQSEIGQKTDIINLTGIKEERLFCKNYREKQENVNIVQVSIHQQTHIKNSAQRNAIISGNMLQKLIRLRCNAILALRRLWVINTLGPKLAAQNVRMNYQPITEIKTISSENYERVYDLHIEDCHEYFANGILVHNCDPTAIVKFTKEGRDIYLELLYYQPVPTPERLDEIMIALGMSKFVPITADSADKYVSEKHGAVKMVRDLFDLGWEISKVSKTKSVMYWLQKMLDCRIHVVKNNLWKHVKEEQQNYVYMEVNGIQINKAVEHGAHFFDGARYAFMTWDVDNMSVSYD